MKKILLVFFLMPFINFSQVQIGQDIYSDTNGDQFGRSIDLSSDGQILAVGAVWNDTNGSNSGSVRIYENQSGVWTQVGNDIFGDLPNDFLGLSVSLSSDGSIVAIGIPGSDINGLDSGSVRVYENQSGVWTQVGQTIYGEFNYDSLGRYVNLNSNGNIVAVTSILHNGSKGQVRIFENQSGVWTQIGSEIEGEEYNDELGWTVELNSSGNIIAVGERRSDGNEGGLNVGRVRIYENQSGVWTQIGQDINGEADHDLSGVILSLSSNGNIVAISAPDNDGNAEDSGHVRVYENLSGVWTQIGSDIDGQNMYDRFGSSMDLSADGSILAIGSSNIDENGLNTGQVKVFKNQLGVWTQIGIALNGENNDQGFGYNLSLSSDGTILAISSLNTTSSSNPWFGSVRIYDLSAVLSVESFQNDFYNVFVNETTESIEIKLHESQILNSVNVYTIDGKYLYSEKSLELNTNNLSRGVYIIEVETNKGKSAKKLIIK